MTQNIERFPGWKGSISRQTAEHLLSSKPVGSYLLRNTDPVSHEVVEELASSNFDTLNAYLCTLVATDDRISDLLLIECPIGWTIYLDNPNLSDPEYTYFPSLTNLMSHLQAKARYPV